MSVIVFTPGAAAAHASYSADTPAKDILEAEGGGSLQPRGGSASAPPARLVGAQLVPAGAYDVIPKPGAAGAAASGAGQRRTPPQRLLNLKL